MKLLRCLKCIAFRYDYWPLWHPAGLFSNQCKRCQVFSQVHAPLSVSLLRSHPVGNALLCEAGAQVGKKRFVVSVQIGLLLNACDMMHTNTQCNGGQSPSCLKIDFDDAPAIVWGECSKAST
jgi:hypothetical protein